jgi:hypothetical protein
VPAEPPRRSRALGPTGVRVAIVIAMLACIFFAAGYWAATR